MNNCANTIYLVVFALLSGCSSKPSTPTASDGPLPLTSSGHELVRYEQSRWLGFGLGTQKSTLWKLDGRMARPENFIISLREAIPGHIRKKLQKISTHKNPKTGESYEVHTYQAWATLISLRPDIMVLTIRPTSNEWECPHPFEDFLFPDCDRSRWKLLENLVELITCDGVELCFHAGTLVPYSEEMYLISTDPKIGCRNLRFARDEEIIQAESFSLRMFKSETPKAKEVFVTPS